MTDIEKKDLVKKTNKICRLTPNCNDCPFNATGLCVKPSKDYTDEDYELLEKTYFESLEEENEK